MNPGPPPPQSKPGFIRRFPLLVLFLSAAAHLRRERRTLKGERTVWEEVEDRRWRMETLRRERRPVSDGATVNSEMDPLAHARRSERGQFDRPRRRQI